MFALGKVKTTYLEPELHILHFNKKSWFIVLHNPRISTTINADIL